MARRKKLRAEAEGNPALDISSLIDVCFLLLIYFMVTSTIRPSEKDIPMNLPSAGAPSDQKIDSLFIKVQPSGLITVGPGDSSESMDSDPSDHSLPLLSDRVELYKSGAELAGDQPVIQLYVDGDAQQQRVLDVLNCLARNNITAITFTDIADD